MKLSILGSCLLVIFFWGACKTDKNKSEVRDTPTSGMINIAADNAYKNLIDSEILVFHSNYSEAKINVHYAPEVEAVNLFLSDSARLLILGRDLDQKEMQKFKQLKYEPKRTTIAIDGIAIIANTENPMEKIDLGSLHDLLTGKKANWNQISNKNANATIAAVMDNKGSGVFRFLQDSLLKGENIGSGVFALNTYEEVISYVQKNKNAIGFIGVNYISDMTDVQNQKFLTKVKILEVSKTDLEEGFLPYQAYLATRQYPLIRLVNIYINEPFNGLGSGFTSFAASDPGQRIVLKDGLVPATMPLRLIQVNPSSSPAGN